MFRIDLLCSGALGLVLGWTVFPRIIAWIKRHRGIKGTHGKKK